MIAHVRSQKQSLLNKETSMKKNNLFLSISLLFLSSASASEMARIRAKHLYASHELGAVTLRHDGMSFHVRQGGALHKVESYDVDPTLRKINKSNLGAYLKQGRIGVTKLSDGSFALRSQMQGLGGGPISGMIAYWATKSLCYGGFIAGAGAAVVLPTTLPALAGAAMLTGGASAAVTTGAGIAAAVITDVGLAAHAGALTVATVSSAGGVAAAVAAVESASLGAATFFTALPFLP
jgi:hypothetical protein